MSVTYQYNIPDIVCAACSSTVESALRDTPFFKDQMFGVDPIEKTLTITFEEEPASYLEIRDVLNEILSSVGFSCVEMLDHTVKKKERWFSHRVLGVLGVIVGTLFLGLSVLTLSPWIMSSMTFLSLSLTLFLGFESYEKAWKKLKKRTLTMDSLFALSTLSIMFVSLSSLIFPSLPMMCEAGVLIFGFRHIGLAIEEAFKNTQWMTKRFQDDAPLKVTRIEAGRTMRVPLKSIQKRDVLLIKPGEILPVDGVFEDQDGLILDRIVTGSNMPRRIIAKEQLYAGTLLSEAKKPMRYVVTANALNSHLARLDAKIAYAKLEKASIEATTSRILQYFIPAILGVAVVSAVLVGALFSTALGIQSAVAVLVSACPCTLGLITPLAVKVGIKKAADSGVIFNSAKKLELADTVEAVVFDLNGTLTEGKPMVVKYGALSGASLSSKTLLRLMAHFEGKCLHPVAKAICDAANRCPHQDIFGKYETELNDYAGRVVRYEGARYTIGSQSLLVRQGVELTEMKNLRQKLGLKKGESLIYLAKEDKLIGYVVLKDTLRKDAKLVIQSLKQLKKRPYLCTGADTETAYEYAKQLGIPKQDVRAHCVSHANAASQLSKKKFIDDLHREGFRVAAVGDGANDAEMIAAADVGFAIFSGGDAHTQQNAAAVIKGTSLQPVLHALKIAKQTVRNIKENLLFSLVYNILTVCLTGGLLLSMGIVLNPAVGAALMILQTSLIFMNVYRFSKSAVTTQGEKEFSHPEKSSLTQVTHQLSTSGPRMCAEMRINEDPPLQHASSAVFKKKSPRHQHADISSIGDSMRFTHT